MDGFITVKITSRLITFKFFCTRHSLFHLREITVRGLLLSTSMASVQFFFFFYLGRGLLLGLFRES